MNYPRPYSDNVLVRLDIHDPTEHRTEGGIIIPDIERATAATKAVYATVCAVGNGRNCTQDAADLCAELEPGMRVIIDSDMAAKDVGERWYDADGREHRMIRAQHVAGIVEVSP